MASFEEYLCTKFAEGLNLEIWEKILVFENQNYKEIVQLALRVEKLTNERVAKGKFQKMRGFGFMFGQSSKKSKSFGFGVESINSPRYFDLHNLQTWHVAT